MNSCCQNDFGDAPRDEDLDWLAFQYVTDELSTEDRIQFEDRLAHDLHACEAVARVTQTLESTAFALAVAVPVVASLSHPAQAPSRKPTTRPARRGMAVAVTAAALLVAAGLWWNFGGSSTTTPVASDDAGDRAQEIVSAWAAHGDAGESEDLVVRPLSLDDDASDLSVPGWMMKAVAQTDDGDSEMEEN